MRRFPKITASTWAGRHPIRSAARNRSVVALPLTILLATLPFSAWAQEPLLRYNFADADDLKGLRVKSPARQSTNGLQLHKPSRVTSAAPPKQLINAVRQSGEITAEVWFTPNNLKQSGPARLFTISKDSVNRNFTIGQDGDQIDVRLRTSKTSANGIPSLATPKKSLTTKLTHLIYSHRKDGDTRIYINGKQAVAKKIGGDLKNWDSSYQLAIGDELNGGRSWLGTVQFVAIYDRSFSADDVKRRFEIGPSGKPSAEAIAERKRKAAARHFEAAVAPILSRHCLECHDTASRAGELDLSKKVAAFKGGENGPSIVAGKADESDLWLQVESDAMPHDREPLNATEKAALKKWINDGAVWSLAEIDPAVYEHSAGDERYVQRLTFDEYITTVQAATGVDIAKEARQLLPADLRADGFSNTSYNLNVDLKHIEAYGRLAESIVSRMNVHDFVGRFSKRRKFTDKDMADVIGKVGKWLLRGPVDDREIIAYRGVMTTVASASGSHDDAMALVIEAMLQSPRFLYRVEQQSGRRAVDDWELASRMSYIIWGGPPDDELFRLAESGKLSSQIDQQAERMLKDPRAVQQSLRFISDWLNLNRLSNLQPNADRFPDWDPALADDMKDETLQFFEDVVWKQQKPLSSLLNAQVTYATPQLAKFYGLNRAASGKDGRYDLSKQPARGGLLTQGSLLTIGGDNASMVTRGLLVMHELLRGVVRDPPPCVDTTPVPSKPGLTQRSVALERINNASCGGCHGRFEPLAFGLERFDGLGAYRAKDEHGNTLREDGEILFPGSAEPVKYQTSAELMDLLAKNDRVAQTLTWKVTQFAIGRPLGANDAATVNNIHQQSQDAGGTWQSIVREIVKSDLVRLSQL